MADENIYQELKDVLEDFKTFLDEQADTIRPAIQALASVIPQITDVIDLLVDLMNQIRTEIANLDLSNIGGDALSAVSDFTGKISDFLDASADLLSEEVGGTVESVRSALNVIGGLPSLDDVKQDILDLIDAIISDLQSLQPA
jgi:phage-related protein